MKFLFHLFTFFALAGYGQSANDFGQYKPYTGAFGPGANPGYYGSAWSTAKLTDLAANVGVKSLRIPLYDDYLTTYGINSELSDIQHMQASGMKELTAFIGSPHASHRDSTIYPTSTEPSKSFKGLYLPIWDSTGKANPANTFASYLEKVSLVYGQYIRFFEVVNEPDFTYSSSGWEGDGDPPGAGSWFAHDPTASELPNLRAPIYVYARMLRIAYEIIKFYCPQSYICTGGIGYRSFLDALLRNTDNPDSGKVTTAYPLKAGAYFDVISFHSYPEYGLKKWANGGFQYFRHSDAAVNVFLSTQHSMDSIAAKYGYNGSIYPKKQFICTETAIGRIMSGQDWGSPDGQVNYSLKVLIACQKSDIKTLQLYLYQLGEGPDSTNQFDRMGLYFYFGGSTTAVCNLQGAAFKGLSDSIYNWAYDPVGTRALNLPSTIDGAAFTNNGRRVYVLWAKTTTDLSEQATASITIGGNVYPLSGRPCIIQEPLQALPIGDPPPIHPQPVPKKWVTVEVYNYVGQLLKSVQTNDIDKVKRELPRGIYILKIYDYFGWKAEKIAK